MKVFTNNKKTVEICRPSVSIVWMCIEEEDSIKTVTMSKKQAKKLIKELQNLVNKIGD